MRASAVPTTPRSFRIAPYAGLSARAHQYHLALYEGYIRQAGTIDSELRRGAACERVERSRPREALQLRLAFEANGARLHELFFEQFEAPGVVADDTFSSCAEAWFGSRAAWARDVKALGEARGSGWVVTTLDPQSSALHNHWIDLHLLDVPEDRPIVFVLDLWEHAYWLDFGASGRQQYIDAVLRGTHRAVVDRRTARALG
jgi:Fe-Mn family superoxide dismutase